MRCLSISTIALLACGTAGLQPAFAQAPALKPPTAFLLEPIHGQPGQAMTFLDGGGAKRSKAANGHDMFEAWMFRAETASKPLADGVVGDGYWARINLDCTARTNSVTGYISIAASGGIQSTSEAVAKPTTMAAGSSAEAAARRLCDGKSEEVEKLWSPVAAIKYARKQPLTLKDKLLIPPVPHILDRVAGEPGLPITFVVSEGAVRSKSKQGRAIVTAWTFRAEMQVRQVTPSIKSDGYWSNNTYDCVARTVEVNGVVHVDATGKYLYFSPGTEPPAQLGKTSAGEQVAKWLCDKKTFKTEHLWNTEAAIKFARSKPAVVTAQPTPASTPTTAAKTTSSKPAASAKSGGWPKGTPFDLGATRRMSENLGPGISNRVEVKLTRRADNKDLYDAEWTVVSTGKKTGDIIEVLGVVDGELNLLRWGTATLYKAKVMPNGSLAWGTSSANKSPDYFWALSGN